MGVETEFATRLRWGEPRGGRENHQRIQREGCEIDIVYAGCGTLVGKMQTGDRGLPDLFMTCDASYLDMVQQKWATRLART